MSEERAKSYGRVGWGIGASVLLHLLVAAAFLVRLPMPVSEPPKEETVQVELVPPPEPPPEPPKEKPKEPEKPELNLTMPKPEEKPPEPPKPEPPKPEPQKPEETKPPEPPKPEPPKPEPPKPEPPKPEAPKPEEQAKPEAPKPEGAQDAGREKAPPLDVLRPVVEFGDKDSGPRKALDGDSAQESTPADAAKPEGETKTQDANAAKPEDGPEGAVPPPETAETADKPPGAPVPDGITVPEVSAAAANPQTDGAPKNPSDALTAALVTPTPRPDGKPKPQAKPEATSDLPQAKRLFSTRDTGDAVARTAMGNIPREIRASQLCSTELKEQLRHGSPAYSPELLPSYRLPSGTVMEVRRGAFRADAQWYDLSFRCELDDKVTKVVSFAFDVGPPVPESQWRRRGFPEF